MPMCAHKEERANARVRNTYLCDRYILLRMQDARPTTRVRHTRAHQAGTIETSEWRSGAVFRKRARNAGTRIRAVPGEGRQTHTASVLDSAVAFTRQWLRHCTKKAPRVGPHADSAGQAFTVKMLESVCNCTAADQRLTDRTTSGAPSVRQHISVRRYPTCPAVLGGPASAKPLARRPRAVSPKTQADTHSNCPRLCCVLHKTMA